MDIALTQNNEGQFDIVLDGPDLKSEQGLRTAVLISLFTDARARDDDELPSNDGDRRGHWADTYSTSSQGSRLWLLERAKENQATLDNAKTYAAEALQWLVEDSVAQTVNVVTSWFAVGKLGIYISVLKGDGTTWQDTFNYELKAA